MRCTIWKELQRKPKMDKANSKRWLSNETVFMIETSIEFCSIMSGTSKSSMVFRQYSIQAWQEKTIKFWFKRLNKQPKLKSFSMRFPWKKITNLQKDSWQWQAQVISTPCLNDSTSQLILQERISVSNTSKVIWLPTHKQNNTRMYVLNKISQSRVQSKRSTQDYTLGCVCGIDNCLRVIIKSSR